MRVEIGESAQADLIQIGDFIARDDPLRARTFVSELTEAAFALADMPNAFPTVERFAGKDIRRRTYGKYLIFYVVGRDRIDVLRILHGARDYEALLFPDA